MTLNPIRWFRDRRDNVKQTEARAGVEPRALLPAFLRRKGKA